MEILWQIRFVSRRGLKSHASWVQPYGHANPRAENYIYSNAPIDTDSLPACGVRNSGANLPGCAPAVPASASTAGLIFHLPGTTVSPHRNGVAGSSIGIMRRLPSCVGAFGGRILSLHLNFAPNICRRNGRRRNGLPASSEPRAVNAAGGAGFAPVLSLRNQRLLRRPLLRRLPARRSRGYSR
jgi:hypothetical protein